MTVQTVIRVCPYKELLPLMGLVWIYYWRTHTSSVVWGAGQNLGPLTEMCLSWFLWFCLTVTQLNLKLLLSGRDGALWCVNCHVVTDVAANFSDDENQNCHDFTSLCCVLCFDSSSSCVLSVSPVFSPLVHVCLPLSATVVSSVIPLRHLTCCSSSPVPRLIISICVFSLCSPACLVLSVCCFCLVLCDVSLEFLVSPVFEVLISGVFSVWFKLSCWCVLCLFCLHFVLTLFRLLPCFFVLDQLWYHSSLCVPPYPASCSDLPLVPSLVFPFKPVTQIRPKVLYMN